MPESNRTDPVEKLLQMQQSFKSKLPDRISGIETAWLLLQKESPPNFTDLHLKIHSLVGTAGTFGASMVSIAAKKLESDIKLLVNNEITLDSDVNEHIEYLLLNIRNISDKWQPSSIPFIPEVREAKVKYKTDWQSNIYLVEDDMEVANTMIQFLENSGYKVFYYRDVKAFEKEYQNNERASAIIMDMSFNEGVIAGAETIENLLKKGKEFPPVIFISVHDDIQARLAAVKVGAKRYFTKPVDKLKLLNSLDKLTHRTQKEPYRILLIDDEEDVLNYYTTILQNDGMKVLSFSSPLEGYRAIEHFKPELIVIDLYMDECSGFDLAKVIRQDDERSSMPIVFLSAELDVTTQLSAMNLGGDDFLIKPVDAEYFAQSIRVRVKRARSVNDLNIKVKSSLRESEYRLIALDQHANISMTDTSGTIIFANQHFETISGYREEELLGRNHRILKSGKHPDDFYDEIWTTISSGKIWSGHICNKSKDGNEYWVESTIVPFMDENGLPYKYVSVHTDITEIKQSEEAAHESEQRLLEQQRTLNTLSTITDYVLLEEDAFFNIVTQRAAETLDIERVSIWMFDKNHNGIVCRKLFERDDSNWSSKLIFTRDDYPKYFSALENNIVISASDAHTHPATADFSRDYLTPLGIGAMLDIPIRRQGRLIGVICCEHIGGKRLWHPDEQAFVFGLSDLVSLNLESSERKVVERKLAAAKIEADNANNAKTEFLSSMSHELRTPMNAISGFAQLLLMDSNNNLDDIQRSNTKEIINASNHLLELINEILNLTKIESGNVALSIETVSYADVLVESLSLMSALIEQRNIKMSFLFNGENITQKDIVPLDVFMHVDRMRLKQILLNLLSNAVKYNNDAGNITISCDVRNDIVRIGIMDTGKGISTDGQDELFKSFSRLGEENGSIEGSGIGLVITKKLVELMGGKIGVNSELHKGSLFWVEFPLVNVSAEKKKNNANKNKTFNEEQEAEYTVLYIEDNPANLRLVERALSTKKNINMVSAHEPVLGLELAYSKQPDLILLDINLPGMNGFDVLKKLKMEDVTKHTPVFAVSANAMLSDIDAGMKAGFDDYITKPIDITAFFVSIMKVLSKIE